MDDSGFIISDVEKVSALLKVLTDDPNKIISLIIPGNPPAKSRPKFGKGGVVYNTHETKALERKTGYAIKNAIKEPCKGNVAVACIFYRDSKQRIDTDNMLKHVCDAANGVAWLDDSQVTAITGIIELDIAKPRTIFAMAPHATTMLRGEDSKRKCKKCKSTSLIKTKQEKALPYSRCIVCDKQLAHRRGGKCRDCWKISFNGV